MSIVLYFLTLIIATARFICPNCSVRLVIFPSVFNCCYFLHLYIVVVRRSFCVDHGPCIYRQACCVCVCFFIFLSCFNCSVLSAKAGYFSFFIQLRISTTYIKVLQSSPFFFLSSFHCIIHRHRVSVRVRTAETVCYCFLFSPQIYSYYKAQL